MKRERTMKRIEVTLEDIVQLIIPSSPGTRAYEYISGKRDFSTIQDDPELGAVVPYIPDGNPSPLFIFKDRSSLTVVDSQVN
jgi:hypothetical protein